MVNILKYKLFNKKVKVDFFNCRLCFDLAWFGHMKVVLVSKKTGVLSKKSVA